MRKHRSLCAVLVIVFVALVKIGTTRAATPNAHLQDSTDCDGSAARCCTQASCCSADAGHCGIGATCSCSQTCGEEVATCSCKCSSGVSSLFGSADAPPVAASSDSLTIKINRPGGVSFTDVVDSIAVQTGWRYSVPDVAADLILRGEFRGTVEEVHRALASEAGFDLNVDAANRSATFLRRR
jgi:hypothetical protein